MRVVNHEIMEPDQLNRGNSLMSAVVEMLDPGTDLFRKRLLNPLPFYGRGQAKQNKIFRPAPRHLTNRCCNKQGGILDDTLAQESAVTSLRQVANESAQISTHTKMIHESCHDTARLWHVYVTMNIADEMR